MTHFCNSNFYHHMFSFIKLDSSTCDSNLIKFKLLFYCVAQFNKIKVKIFVKFELRLLEYLYADNFQTYLPSWNKYLPWNNILKVSSTWKQPSQCIFIYFVKMIFETRGVVSLSLSLSLLKFKCMHLIFFWQNIRLSD